MLARNMGFCRNVNDACTSLKKIIEIKKMNIPYKKTIDLLKVYIPNIKEKFNVDIKNKTSLTGGKELDIARRMLIETYITNYFIANIKKCKIIQKKKRCKTLKKPTIVSVLKSKIKGKTVSKKIKYDKLYFFK